jgi:peroxiredoxin
MKRFIILCTVTILVVVGMVGITACKKSTDVDDNGAAVEGIRVGDIAPDFAEESYLGQTVTLSEYKGKVILLTFSAMWCSPCRQEAPSLDGLYNTYKERGLEIVECLYQDEDGNPADLSDLARWMAEFNINFMVFRDEDRSCVNSWNFGGIPFNVVIDRDMIIRYRAEGFDQDAVTNKIESLL